MSRSIHRNRSVREIEKRGAFDFEALARKRRVKRLVARERGARRSATLPAVSAASIPIRRVRVRPPLWFPATAADVRAVLRRLPDGALNGVREIRLESGKKYLDAEAWRADGEVRDPHFGRRSFLIRAGVFSPIVLGTYDASTGSVTLYGYVRIPGTAIPWIERMALKYHMLRTLVHELAHNFDAAHRVARGRWRMDDEDKDERYAGRIARRWCSSCVLPYLKSRYQPPTPA